MADPRQQEWNAENYGRQARFVSDLGAPVLALLDPQPGERILDLGCGDGALSERLVARGAQVVGIDASAAMVAAARARGLEAIEGNGTALSFDGGFDAVFSNAALHWMRPPEAVLAGVWRALRPGGRFVAEMGGYGHVTLIHGALRQALAARGLTVEPDTFFPTPEAYRGLLEAVGFQLDHLELFERPTPLPGTLGDWIDTFAHHYTGAVPAEQRPALVAEVVVALRPQLCDGTGTWHADYVRLRFSARRPTEVRR
jgi:trans-aconitate methyltransferase